METFIQIKERVASIRYSNPNNSIEMRLLILDMINQLMKPWGSKGSQNLAHVNSLQKTYRMLPQTLQEDDQNPVLFNAARQQVLRIIEVVMGQQDVKVEQQQKVA